MAVKPRATRLLAFLACVGLVTSILQTSASAKAIIEQPNPPPKPSSSAIHGGLPIDLTTDHAYFVKMFITMSSGVTEGCGGVLISSKHILTAAHCAVDQTRLDVELADLSPEQYIIKLHDNTSVKAASVTPHTKFKLGNKDTFSEISESLNHFDLAIIELEEETGVEPATLGDWLYPEENSPIPTSFPMTGSDALLFIAADNVLSPATTGRQAAVAALPFHTSSEDETDCADLLYEAGGQVCFLYDQVNPDVSGIGCVGDSGGPFVQDDVVRGVYSGAVWVGESDGECKDTTHGVAADLWGSRCWINEQVEKDGEEDSGLKVSWSHSDGLDPDVCVDTDREGTTPTCSTALVDAYKDEKQRIDQAFSTAVHEYENSPEYLSWLAEHEAAQEVALAYVYSVEQPPASDDVAAYAAWQLASVEVGNPPPGRPQVNWDSSLSDAISNCQNLFDAWGDANQEDPSAAEAVSIVAGGLTVNFEFVVFVSSTTTTVPPVGVVRRVEVWKYAEDINGNEIIIDGQKTKEYLLGTWKLGQDPSRPEALFECWFWVGSLNHLTAGDADDLFPEPSGFVPPGGGSKCE